jgi:hypothetical protein
MTIGMREVERKREAWRARAARDGGEFLGAHMVPAVAGPGGRLWLIDHHHLVRALHEEGVKHVLVSLVADLAHLPKKRFLAFMDQRNWLHPFDAEGQRRDAKDLPRRIDKLDDDPWRSLAGEVRRAGGFAKSQVPYTEFLWADFLRDHVAREIIDKDFDRALHKGLKLARHRKARHLPGFAGPED